MIKLSNDLFDYFLISLFIAVSGGVLCYIEYGEIFVPFFLIISFVHFIIGNTKIYYFDKKNKNYNILFLFIVISYLLLNCAINFSNKINSNEVIIFILLLVGSYFTISSIKYEKFRKIYLNIISFLCIISLVVWGLSVLNVLPYQKKEINDTVYCLFLYHNLGWDYVQGRNSSIFWEPGIYQIFLNIGIFLLLFSKQKLSHRKLAMLILLLIGVITTKSTTGYLVTMVIFTTKMLSNMKRFKHNALIYLPLFIITIIGVIVILNTPTITEKFSTGNYSFGERIKQNIMSVELMKNKFVFGYGINSEFLQSLMLRRYGLKSNSNGLFVFILYFGIPMVIIYIVMFIKKRNNFKVSKLAVFVIWIMINATEYFLIFPLAYIFIFEFKSEKKYIGGDIHEFFR